MLSLEVIQFVFRQFDAQAERSEYKNMVFNAASQNEIWVMAMQNFKTWEPLILEHAPKFQATLALLQDENREKNEEGVDEATALLPVWLAAFKTVDSITRMHGACLSWVLNFGAAAVSVHEDASQQANLTRTVKLSQHLNKKLNPEKEALVASIARDAKTALEESQMAGALDRLVKVMEDFDIESIDNVYLLQTTVAGAIQKTLGGSAPQAPIKSR